MALSNKKNHFQSALSRQATRNWSGKIYRWSLMSPSNSAFLHLFSVGSSPWQDLIMQHFMSSYNIFSTVLAVHTLCHFWFKHEATTRTQQSMRLIFYNLFCIALFLVLKWTRRTRDSCAALQVIFGMTVSNISKWLCSSK